MPKVVSASEAKNRFGSMITWTDQSRDEIIVEVHGQPKAVIIAYDEYLKMTQLRETQRRQQLLARLEQLRSEVQAQNPEITIEQADEVAQEIRDALLDRVIQSRKQSSQTPYESPARR